MANKKQKPQDNYDFDGCDDDVEDRDYDVEYLRRTTDRRHKVDLDPTELNFDD